MSNNTINSYKKAVKSKYEMEKKSGNSIYLSQPSQANLRKLCWQKFENSSNQNDLNIFKTFFGFSFDLTQKNTFTTKTDRFKPVGAFFRGETASPTDDVIEIAAILVDFNPRPFNKFRSILVMDEASGVVCQNELLLSEKGRLLCNEKTLKDKEVGVEGEDLSMKASFLDFRNKNSGGKIKSWKQNIIGVSFIFLLGFVVSYYFFLKKECMQWSGNHYEEVSCDLDVQSVGSYGVVVPLDRSVLNLQKVVVTDTTVFFKNGEALIWYAKTANGIEFFNTHGRHPDNNHALKPVTAYIIKKYVK